MAVSSWYTDGTVSVANGSDVVVGSGTLWQTQAAVGDMFGLLASGGVEKLHEVVEVTDATHLKLRHAWTGSDAMGASYALVRNFGSGAWSMSSAVVARLSSHIQEFNEVLKRNFKGDKGDPGDDGNTILGGNGAPNVALGIEGDWYLDMSTWGMYRKEAGAWVLRGSLRGPQGTPGANGTIWHFGAGSPSLAIGADGDAYLDTATGDAYLRTTGAWLKQGNIRGPKGDVGDQGPQGATGQTGAAGAPGSVWLVGSGTPAGGLGANGDYYLNSANGDVYRKESGAWTLKANIRGLIGPQGERGPVGIAWRGAWSAGTAYATGDGVLHGGSSWFALQASTGATPPNPDVAEDANWRLVARKGTDGTGSGDMMRVDYDPDNDGIVEQADHATTAGSAESAQSATSADVALSAPWSGVTGKPSAYPAEAHALASHQTSTLAELNAILAGTKIAADAAATETEKGLVELATTAEAVAGTDAERAVTSAALKAAMDGRGFQSASAFQGWLAGGAFARASDATFTVTDDAANQAIFCKGRPIRFRQNSSGSWFYAVVVGYASGTVTLSGAPLSSTIGGDAGRELQYGDFWRVVEMDLFVPGDFASAAASNVMESKAKTWQRWRLSAARCVFFSVRAKTAYGTAAPKINVLVAGNKVSTDDSNNGISAIASQWTDSTTNTSTANYAVAFGDAVELSTTQGTGSAGDTLSAQILFVLA